VYFVYLLLCGDGSLYTGITNDLKRRFIAHQKGQGGHYTRTRRVVRFVYTEEHKDRSSALKREAEIKGWRKERKLALIGVKKLAKN
jgi:putative endonuclease